MSPVVAYGHVEDYLRERCAVWLYRLGLDHWKVTLTFLDCTRDPDDNSDQSVAECKPQWQYMRAEIIWYLPILAACDDEKLDWDSLHECVHILLAAEQANLKTSEAERMELSTEYTTRALWKAWERAVLTSALAVK